MLKSGTDMLRCAQRCKLLWECDIFKRKQLPLCYNVNRLASTMLGSKNNTALASKVVIGRAPYAGKEPTTAKKSREVLKLIEYNNELLAKCITPIDVLDELHRCYIPLNRITAVLSSMWQCNKKMTTKLREMQIMLIAEHPQFNFICKRLMTGAWSMKDKHLVYSLSIAINLGVSQNSPVVQTLLRVLKLRSGRFDFDCLSSLACGISSLENTRDVQKLRETLRLPVKDYIPQLSNLKQLYWMMCVVGKDSPEELKIQLMEKALALVEKLPSENVQPIFSGLAAMDQSSTPLLNVCSNNIIENVHLYTFRQYRRILNSCYTVKYKNFALFRSISEQIITSDVYTETQVMRILTDFGRLHFRAVELLDLFAERIFRNAKFLTKQNLPTVLKIFTMANHDFKGRKAEFLSILKPVIEVYYSRMSCNDLLRTVYSLAINQLFPRNLLKRLFKPNTVEFLLKNGQAGNLYMLHIVNLSLSLDNPPLYSSITSLHQLNLPSLKSFRKNNELPKLISEIVEADAVQPSVLEQGVYLIGKIDPVILSTSNMMKECLKSI